MPVQHAISHDRASEYPEALSTWNGQPPLWRVILYPHRSLPATGFVWVIVIASVGLALPLLGVFGTPVLWGVLPFMVLTVAGLWYFIMRNYRDGHLIEELSLWPDRLSLVRIGPKQERQDWAANPYWVQVKARDKPVETYLTLQGGPREVELGAFLAPEERAALKRELEDELRGLAQA